MAACKNTAQKARIPPDLPVVVERFSLALSILIVAHRALDLTGKGSDEEVTLRHGLGLLHAVYDDLDKTVGAS